MQMLHHPMLPIFQEGLNKNSSNVQETTSVCGEKLSFLRKPIKPNFFVPFQYMLIFFVTLMYDYYWLKIIFYQVHAQLSWQTLVTIDAGFCVPEVFMKNAKKPREIVQGQSYKRLGKIVSKNIGVVMRFSASEGFGGNNKHIIVLYISLKVTTFVVMGYSWLTNRKQRGFRDGK